MWVVGRVEHKIKKNVIDNPFLDSNRHFANDGLSSFKGAKDKFYIMLQNVIAITYIMC